MFDEHKTRTFTAKKSLECTPCVYEVWRNGRCIYVGQTVNLRRRFYSHKFEFCKVVAHPQPAKPLRIAHEERLIRDLMPLLNIQRKASRAGRGTVGSRVDKSTIIGTYCEWVA